MSYENAVAHPDSGDRTIVVNLDDSTPGQVYVYVGTKKRTGSPVDRAGLTRGALYGIKVTDGGVNYANGPAALEDNGAISGAFELEPLSDVAPGAGALLQTTSRARGVTEFARPEDGAWDTKNARAFYFVTTGASVGSPSRTQTARLYKLTFDSLQNPSGGSIELVVDAASLTGTDGQSARSFDNLTVDGSGRVLIQEDPGNTSYIAKTWRINPATADAEQVLESDRQRFITGAPLFLTQDEENSGIIEVTDLLRHARWFERGRRYYLADAQAHKSLPSPFVEEGQLYLITSRKLQ
jgi:secreted PhoX family phosphatase